MKSSIDLKEIITLVLEQHRERQDLIEALQACSGGQWTDSGYFQFVSPIKANEPGAEGQHKECVVIEHRERGTFVIDFLKDGRIGGIEFLDLIDQ